MSNATVRESARDSFYHALIGGLHSEIDVCDKYCVSIDKQSGVLEATVLLEEITDDNGYSSRPSQDDIRELIAVLNGALDCLDIVKDDWKHPDDIAKIKEEQKLEEQ